MKFLEDMNEDEKCAVIRQRGGSREHLLDILQELQSRSRVHVLDPLTVDLVAKLLEMPRAVIMDVIGFYAMLSTEPQADCVIEVCRSNPCNLGYSRTVVDQLQKELGVSPYEVTEDGRFVIRFMDCVGACESGPIIRVGDALYGNLTPEKISGLIADLRNRK